MIALLIITLIVWLIVRAASAEDGKAGKTKRGDQTVIEEIDPDEINWDTDEYN